MTSSTSSTHPIIATPVPLGAVVAYAGYVNNQQGRPTGQKENEPQNQYQGVQPANLESQGWMVCDGRLLSCSLYPQLFEVLGFQYSQSGDSYESGYTGLLNNDARFRIPDYRGYFLHTVAGHVDPDINSFTSVPTDEMPPLGAEGSQVDPDINSFTSGSTGETAPTGIVNLSQVPSDTNTTVDYIIKFA